VEVPAGETLGVDVAVWAADGSPVGVVVPAAGLAAEEAVVRGDEFALEVADEAASADVEPEPAVCASVTVTVSAL
jgi:hypothetical protein